MQSRHLRSGLARVAVVCVLVAATANGGDARAEPSTPFSQISVATEKCDHVAVLGAEQIYYAEHVYPKQTAAALARVSILARRAAGPRIPGYHYERLSNGIFVRDGAVAVICGRSPDGILFDQIEFVMPRRYVLDTRLPWIKE